MTATGQTTATTARDNRPLAILSLVAGVGLSATMDTLMKWLSGDYPVHQLLVLRCVTAIPVLLVILWFDGQAPRLWHPAWPAILLRGLILAFAYVAFVMAIAAMPMADGVAIYFTMPLILAALAGPMLGERVPAYRWAAILAGFAGVMAMIRPGSGLFEPAALLALCGAAGYAVGQLLTRRIGLSVASSVLAFHQNSIYLAVGLALAALFAGGAFEADVHPSIAFLLRGWHMPDLLDFCLMCALGILSGLAMTAFTQAYRLAEANLVAPFEYTAMAWAAAYGFLIFGDVPDWATGVGGALVIGAGLFMLWRDRRAA